MICDLCTKEAHRVSRVASWQICQWCESNKVLEHALEVEVDIAKLKRAVAKTGATHQRDVRNETEAKAKLELTYAAYQDLTTAMKALAATKIVQKRA
jgi:hypothetical protein